MALPNFEQDGAKSVASPNYNELTEPGFYGCPAAGATNGPGNARKLLVMGLPGAKNFVTQVAFPITEGVCPAIRFLDADGGWTPWKKLPLVDQAEDLQASRLTATGGQLRTSIKGFTKGGELPTTSVYSHWSIFDENGFDYTKNRMGAFQYRASNDGSSFISMWVNANNANDVTAASLGIGVKKDGTVYTYAPTPRDDCDSETEIATAHWARSFGGTTWGLGTVAPSVNSRFNPNDCNSINKTGFYTLSSTANSSPLYATSILQHIERAYTAGVTAAQISFGSDGKTAVRTRMQTVWSEWYELARRSTYDTFTSGEHYISNANVTFGTVSASTQWTRVLFCDKTKTKALGYIGHRDADDGQRRVVMLCYKPDGSGDSTSLWVGYDAAGKIKTFAPTPVSSSNDDSIPTTRWVRANTVPTGTILPFAGTTVPTGFLLCNGALVSRTTYAALYAAIGTKWGSGDGSTTFKLPDLRKRHLEGVNTASEVGGYLQAGLPNITGTFYARNDDGAPSGAFSRVAGWSGGFQAGGYGNHDKYTLDASDGSAAYGASSTVTPPSAQVLYIIKS